MTRLFVVPTPIGNLQDITLRALDVLREVPIILAEDTRHTRKLLNAHDIHTRLLSFHQHNARQRLARVLGMLAEGDVALVTDAGMPAISDPGFELVDAAIAAGGRVPGRVVRLHPRRLRQAPRPVLARQARPPLPVLSSGDP